MAQTEVEVNIRKKRTLPDQMSQAQFALYEKIALGTRAAESAFPLVDEKGALTGPFDAMLLIPEIGDALQAVGSAIRFSGHLTDRAREIAILLVAHHHGSAFEVFAHEAVGRRIGLTDSDLADLSECRAPHSADEYERAVSTTVNYLLRHADLDDDSYISAVEHLGEDLLFEINALVGYYSLLAVQIKIFGV
ncbi:carboxymuconolactone decarboxylase family protein (plasmid) [Rhodococcus opacus]|uniref:carboxymuconolactone decarboxylase family protein n=1 Tax=Rhodococcus opacus TaxID=37919 RepID=UPI0034D16B0E